MKYAYSPATGEIIDTDSPADWMGTTTVTPPLYNKATQGCFWRDNAWAVVDSEAGETVSDPKMTGIEFDGVMCSATSQDQSGLLAVLMAFNMDGASFQPTRFRFSNGNSLVITKDNLLHFMSGWKPFRQSFFAVD